MENVGLVTYNEAYIQKGLKLKSRELAMYNTLIHETVHQWFGNLVTMRWWDDLWLNEAFATFIAYEAQSNWPWKDQYQNPWMNACTRKTFA